MSTCAWVVTNLKPEVDLASWLPVSRIVLELLGEPWAAQRPPVALATDRDHLKPRLLATLEDTALNMPEERLPVYDGLIRDVSWRTAGRTVQVAVETAFPARVRQIWEPGVPVRLGLELERRAVMEIIAGRRIGLDPGHGGRDAGAVGAAYRECEVVLKINRFLSRWLAAHRAVCVLSREDDVEVPLETRLRLMRRERLDAYIGLHTGSDTDRRRRGTAVLYRRDEASERLARYLQAAILTKNPFLVNGGIHPSDETMFSSLRAPAVIVLPEYITHHLGEGLLRAVDFQERIAQSLFDGLTAYFRHSPGAVPSG